MSRSVASVVDEVSSRIAIITDDPGWHGRVLKQALKKHGFDSTYISLTDARLAIDENPCPVQLPGFEQAPPVGVFVRGVPGGTLEQVIYRLNLLHLLVDQGIPVYNTPRAIERTVDKSMTSYLLQKAGLKTPATWVCESIEQARAIYAQETTAGQPLVIKPLFGSQGIGVQKVSRCPDADMIAEYGDVFYLQRFLQPQRDFYQDLRVFVIDGEAVAAMTRSHNEWITNRAQGAQCKPMILTDSVRDIAEAAVQACQIDYAGVDLIVDVSGQMYVLEVNSIPAWWGLQKVVEVDIAAALIQAFVSRIQPVSQNSQPAYD